MGIDVHGARVVARYQQEEPIPLLEEVLGEIAPRAAINVELKLDAERWWSVAVAEVTARTIAAAGAASRVIVSSFDPRKLRAAQRVCPEVPVGFCFDDGMLRFAAPVLQRWPGRRGARPAEGQLRADRAMLARMCESHLVGRVFSSKIVAAEHTLLTAQSAQRLHQRGVALGTHTLFPLGSTTGKPIDPAALRAEELHRLVSIGVDWIETDDPLRAMELMARGR
jgi:glycerophosphoryl diester phosphodiesterase